VIRWPGWTQTPTTTRHGTTPRRRHATQDGKQVASVAGAPVRVPWTGPLVLGQYETVRLSPFSPNKLPHNTHIRNSLARLGD
jgi:hypothetical protein